MGIATTDSNVWGGASGHTYNFTRHPNGTTDVDVVVVREGKNLKSRLLGLVLKTVGRKRRFKIPSRPSRPGTARLERRERQAHHEPGTCTVEFTLSVFTGKSLEQALNLRHHPG